MLVLLIAPVVGQAQHGPKSVLWFNSIPNLAPEVVSSHREKMARYVDQYQGGGQFNVRYVHGLRGGMLARELRSRQYDILVLDLANQRTRMNNADKAALQLFYGSGRSNLILDGSFGIRNMSHNPKTVFPGANGSSAGLLMNQLYALSERGGGILIGTDHDIWQSTANFALGALVPGARFRGSTNPSTNGDFIGTTLLASRVSITARDVLRHWESVPNQGEAPVGQYTDFTGRQVVLYALVETADKPGRGRKRPYISASFFPGEDRTPIDSEKPVQEKKPVEYNLPTHKSAP